MGSVLGCDGVVSSLDGSKATIAATVFCRSVMRVSSYDLALNSYRPSPSTSTTSCTESANRSSAAANSAGPRAAVGFIFASGVA